VSAPPAPAMVGCFRCGRRRLPGDTVHATCEACGKTVGICRHGACAQVVRNPRWFIDESMDWHRRHACGRAPRVTPVVGAPAPPATEARRWRAGQGLV
jgi:hypothetical protein